jgi:hypothetical protein
MGLSLIQFEWALCQAGSDKRMFIDIMDGFSGLSDRKSPTDSVRMRGS